MPGWPGSLTLPTTALDQPLKGFGVSVGVSDAASPEGGQSDSGGTSGGQLLLVRPGSALFEEAHKCSLPC